ncbi:MAG TPA: hypothetical protein VG710_10000 [Opitutus sp.]|nr:hypothetical protein [Opitutus sp.]
MPPAPQFWRGARGLAVAVLAFSALLPLRADEPAPPGKTTPATESARDALAHFIDRLPDLLDLGLPGFAPEGAWYFYSHPKFGDFLHEDYFRLPVGVRYKVTDKFELHGELGTYFTNGFGASVGNGLYEFQAGLKQEGELWIDTGASVGLDFVTPLSRPPLGITDGLRHTLPYVTLTRSLWPEWDVVVFGTFGADLLDHTNIPPDFRTNELRANSLMLTLGLAREWRHLHVILKVTDGTTLLLSGLHQNAFGIRPSIGIPFLRRHDGSPRATATFEGRMVWGPDGLETGVTTSVRVDLRYRHANVSTGE